MANRVFQRGETAQAYAEVRDPDSGELVDPTGSFKINLYDPATTQKVTLDDWSKVSTGIYIYNYNTVVNDVTGFWRAEAVFTDGSGPTAVIVIEDGGFELK